MQKGILHDVAGILGLVQQPQDGVVKAILVARH
jgi:hypothetical protein